MFLVSFYPVSKQACRRIWQGLGTSLTFGTSLKLDTSLTLSRHKVIERRMIKIDYDEDHCLWLDSYFG